MIRLYTAALFLSLCSSVAIAGMHDPAGIDSTYCLSCHPRALPTHTLKTPQGMKEPLPLDANGKMVCLTCHKCAQGVCGLRKDSGKLCSVCHDCTTGMACLLGMAHMGNRDDLDDQAVNGCLGCHDGTIGPDISRDGHKVDVLYVKGEPGKFRTLTDRRIVMVDGKVTCLSCHNPYKRNESHLVLSNNDSRLCLKCHIK